MDTELHFKCPDCGWKVVCLRRPTVTHTEILAFETNGELAEVTNHYTVSDSELLAPELKRKLKNPYFCASCGKEWGSFKQLRKEALHKARYIDALAAWSDDLPEEYLLTDIEYDVDDPDDLTDLPCELRFRISPDSYTTQEELEEAASSYISDKTGFCHNGFNMRKLKLTNKGTYRK